MFLIKSNIARLSENNNSNDDNNNDNYTNYNDNERSIQDVSKMRVLILTGSRAC
jgi:hypothetical protein